jgi:capsular polysaccharide transport system permease protein
LDNATTATVDRSHKPSIIDRIKGINRLFLYSVVLPTTLSVLYFGLIASPVYISESRFVVYSPSQSFSASSITSLLSGASGNNSTSAAYTIQDYMQSWDAMMALNAAYDLRKIYANHHIDIINRFGGLFYPLTSYVELLRYYNGKVSDSIDTTSGNTKLIVHAYSAADAQKINAFLLQKSQDIVNKMNSAARHKAVYYAQNEVDAAEQKLRAATLTLAQYRNKHQVFSPPAQSALQLGMIAKMQEQLITEKSQIDAIRSRAPNNPQLSVLESNVRVLENEINDETSKVTGSEQSLASKDIEYERDLVDQLLGQKLLEAAVTSLEQAKVTAQKQELYLETISQPNLPDAPQEPKRFQDIIATLLVSFIVYGILTIVIAGVREHHDR